MCRGVGTHVSGNRGIYWSPEPAALCVFDSRVNGIYSTSVILVWLANPIQGCRLSKKYGCWL